jgi:loricrin
MRAASVGWVSIVLATFACATAEDVTDDGTQNFGGAVGDGGPDVKVDGKVDNPSGGGSGGATSGGGTTASGGSPSGGEAGSGGGETGGSGGTIATGGGGAPSGGTGSGGATGGTGGSSCGSGLKKCGGLCISPSPSNGCTLNDGECTACVAPTNGSTICTSNVCDFTCNAGYTKSGISCVSSTGSGGGGGTGGGTSCPAPCDPSKGESQFLCASFCLLGGKNFGLCAPGANCCLCT